MPPVNTSASSRARLDAAAAMPSAARRHEDIEGELRSVIAGAAASQQLTNVAGQAGDTQQAGVVLEDPFESIGRNAVRNAGVEQHAGIDRSRARAHGQAFERGEAHRRRHGRRRRAAGN